MLRTHSRLARASLVLLRRAGEDLMPAAFLGIKATEGPRRRLADLSVDDVANLLCGVGLGQVGFVPFCSVLFCFVLFATSYTPSPRL